jgi:ribonuclease G
MSKEIYISSTPHETRLAIVENDALTEIYYERENEYTLAGSIYNGKVTRVLPGMQSSFVDIGLDRDAFLYITDFMEEAGDTADFEASAGGDSRRAPRDSGRDNGRGDRARRSDRAPDRNVDSGEKLALPRPEPSDAELFTEAVASIDASRPVSDSERGDRNRRGGRNRRDRNPDRNPDRNHGDSRRPEVAHPEAIRPESILVQPPAPEVTAELGEGAPGADGSRRWRGRRGRRGNRGAGFNPALPVAAASPARGESTGPIHDAYEVEAEPEFEPEAPIAAPVETSYHERPGGGRNERGGRDRRDRAAQPPRVPRGFAPSHDLYQVEGSADSVPYGTELESAAVEPIILPGESLSKYRAPGETPAAAAPATSPAPVASEFVAHGWDGGLVLPGETIRPRTPSASTSFQGDAPREFRRDDRGGRDRSRNDRGSRGDDRGGRPERPWQPAAAAAVVDQRHAPIQHESEPAHTPSEPELSSHLVTPLDSTFVAPPPLPESVPEPIVLEEEIVHEEVEFEYEPAEASASYRVDPAAPSEFRQASPVFEEEIVEEEEFHEPRAAAEEHVPAVELAPEPISSYGSAPDEEVHEITSIFPDGEMHSEPESLVTQDLVAPSTAAQGPELSTEPVPADVIAADQSIPQGEPWFAPGSGVLEEELLEDDEDTLPTVHGHHIGARDHEPQDLETLEHAADLGVMLREMSIDNLTHTEPAVEEDDEDDFDEDFLEEDQDHSLEVSEGDDFEEGESGEPEDSLEEPGEGEPGIHTDEFAPAESASGDTAPSPAREPRRNDRGRRDGRRNDRSRRSGGDRERGNSASDRPSGDRERRHGGRPSMQSTNLPAISDLLKPGQEILCQIAKEPIAKKGARITSHIALPGRFLVFMPTVNHTGVSRKIESDGERRRLKEILLSEKGDASGGFIVRTAAEGASEEELRSDLRFLLNLWADIKARSESSKSPALIYHDLNLVERVLRDQVTDNFSAIWVDTETDYERILRFLQRFQPSLIRRVKLYTKETPLFEQFGITEEINKALRSKVWLKSGGSIVINQTEALVAIDINTGKFVGKTARLEDTIVKTNLDAIPEIVRQIRLRDLGGIIIIDFIDMDERKNRNKVMAALEEELKSDRAPSKVLPFNDFGLVAITRKRVKQSLERTLSTTCGVCQGTGMVKSPVTVCNDIYIEMRKMQKHLDRGDVMLRVHPEVVKQLKSTTSRWLQEMEEMIGKTILVKSDPSLHPEQFDLH